MVNRGLSQFAKLLQGCDRIVNSCSNSTTGARAGGCMRCRCARGIREGLD